MILLYKYIAYVLFIVSLINNIFQIAELTNFNLSTYILISFAYNFICMAAILKLKEEIKELKEQ